jgi:predicted AAA+ superfamily ATPase
MKIQCHTFNFRTTLGPMVERPEEIARVRHALRRSRVVALVGPRQCGKTTLAREIVPAGSLNYFDLEDPLSLIRLGEPMTALSRLRGVVVIDEVQRRPDLFPVLRVLVDRRPLPAKFLVLGSASPGLQRQSAESLAGRIEVVSLSGFSLGETGPSEMSRLWLRGGFPPAYLARSREDSFAWRRELVRTFLERDVPELGIRVPAAALLRFWSMLSHYHGGVWNAAEFARALGVSEPTVRRYLDLLSGLYLVRQLLPWHENIGKRQVKSPKVYVRDSGLLHQLLGVKSEEELLLHPRCGASWEGFAIEETLKAVRADDAYFWATHTGAELDLLLLKDGRRLGVEVKRADAPRLTPSMRAALHDLRLEQLTVLYPGETSYLLADRVTVRPLATVASGARGLFPPRRRSR